MTLLPSENTVTPVVFQGTCTSGGCPNVRLDNITASGWGAYNVTSDQALTVESGVFGVADHNQITDTASVSSYTDFVNVAHPSWLGVGSYGDNSWASADTFGTASAFYIENNTFNNTVITDTDTNVGGGGGARWVCRFNIVNGINPTGGGCGDHGTDTTGRARGGRQIEFYENVGTCTNATIGCNTFGGGGRSGISYIWGNNVSDSGGGFFKSFTTLDIQRRWRDSSPWGLCDGSGTWDTNTGTTYYSGTIGSISFPGPGYQLIDLGSPGWSTNQWENATAPYSVHVVSTAGAGFEIGSNTSNTINAFNGCTPAACAGVVAPVALYNYQILKATACIDQVGRSGGALLSGITPTPASPVNQSLDPDYEMDDVVPSGTGYPTLASSTQGIAQNLEYYSESPNQAAQTSTTSPFNGTSGTGHGTLANRPTTCTAGVGYFATDQGTWNTSGGSNPANYSGQGELFVCGTGNSWNLDYTPYTYPHPLDGGTAAPAPAAPTLLPTSATPVN
jgi:hypothetical protein